MRLDVRVIGRPAPQGSHEIGQHGHLLHSSKYLEAWRAAVNRAVRAEYLRLGLTLADMPLIAAPAPVYVDITHYVKPDQCRAAGTEEPTGSPDYDKLLRATTDGLGMARAFTNDSQIKRGTTAKERPAPGVAPGALIIISDAPIDGADFEIREIGTMAEYRLVLERLVDDTDGAREWETVVEVQDDQAAIAQLWLPAVGRKLGAVPPAEESEDDSYPQDVPAAEVPKRRRRTKAQIEAARAAVDVDKQVEQIHAQESATVLAAIAEHAPEQLSAAQASIAAEPETASAAMAPVAPVPPVATFNPFTKSTPETRS